MAYPKTLDNFQKQTLKNKREVNSQYREQFHAGVSSSGGGGGNDADAITISSPICYTDNFNGGAIFASGVNRILTKGFHDAHLRVYMVSGENDDDVNTFLYKNLSQSIGAPDDAPDSYQLLKTAQNSTNCKYRGLGKDDSNYSGTSYKLNMYNDPSNQIKIEEDGISFGYRINSNESSSVVGYLDAGIGGHNNWQKGTTVVGFLITIMDTSDSGNLNQNRPLIYARLATPITPIGLSDSPAQSADDRLRYTLSIPTALIKFDFSNVNGKVSSRKSSNSSREDEDSKIFLIKHNFAEALKTGTRSGTNGGLFNKNGSSNCSGAYMTDKSNLNEDLINETNDSTIRSDIGFEDRPGKFASTASTGIFADPYNLILLEADEFRANRSAGTLMPFHARIIIDTDIFAGGDGVSSFDYDQPYLALCMRKPNSNKTGFTGNVDDSELRVWGIVPISSPNSLVDSAETYIYKQDDADFISGDDKKNFLINFNCPVLEVDGKVVS